MRIAIISDVHGNIHALDAVLADLDASGPYDEIVYGGDVAFNGAFPSECIDRMRERGYRAVRGNTDEFLVVMARGSSYETSVTDDTQQHSPRCRSWTAGRTTGCRMSRSTISQAGRCGSILKDLTIRY